MQMLIENIGGIKKAEIDLSGLCVIVSEDGEQLKALSGITEEVVRLYRTHWVGNDVEYNLNQSKLGGKDDGYRYTSSPGKEGRLCVTKGDKVSLDVRFNREGKVRVETSETREYGCITLFPIECCYRLSLKKHERHDSWMMWDNVGIHKTALFWEFPENGCHPKTQIERAKLIIEHVRRSEFSLVLSHSPYIVEALKRYSDRDGLSARFGLIEDGVLEYDRLSDIFDGFAEPFEELSRMDANIDIRPVSLKNKQST